MKILLRMYKSTIHRNKPWRFEVHINGVAQVESIRRYSTKREVAASGRLVAGTMGHFEEELGRYAMEAIDVETEID